MIVILIILQLLVLASCAGASEADDRLLVVASTSILGDVVENIVGDAGRVETLMPRGTDAHEFQPSARQAATVREADLLVVNGLGLEEGLTDTIESARLEGVEVLELAPMLDPIPLEDGLDPHVWMDPVRMARGAGMIAARLARVGEGPSEDEWMARGRRYGAQILTAHREVVSLLAEVPEGRRKLVTNHEALGYLAERYDLDVIGTIIPGGSTLAEPSARRLAELVDLVKREDVPAIFAETTDPSSLAGALAQEAGGDVEVVTLYTESLGEPGSEADTYLGMLLTNAALISEALR